MMETANDSFQIVGQRPAPERTARLPKKWFQGKPLISIMILAFGTDNTTQCGTALGCALKFQ